MFRSLSTVVMWAVLPGIVFAQSSDHSARFELLRSAEQVADPLQRCLRYPSLTGVSWTAGDVKALCEELVTQAVPSQEQLNWLRQGDTDRLDTHFADRLRDYWASAVSEEALTLDYTRLAAADPGGDLLELWVRNSPASAHARLASSLWHVQAAGTLHFDTRRADILPDHVAKLAREVSAAAESAKRARELEPRLLPAYVVPVLLSTMGGDASAGKVALDAGLKLRPDSYLLHSARMDAAMAQEGGSDALRRLEAEALRHAGSNKRLMRLRSVRPNYEGQLALIARNYTEAARLFEDALAAGPDLSLLTNGALAQEKAGNDVRSAEYLSQVVRFKPESRKLRAERAAALVRAGQREWARSEAIQAMEVSPVADDALEVYVVTAEQDQLEDAAARLREVSEREPENVAARYHLARLLHYRLERGDEAAPLVDSVLAANPRKGGAWLMRYLNLPATDRAASVHAAEQFVAFVDLTDPQQEEMLPQVKAWLAGQGGGSEG